MDNQTTEQVKLTGPRFAVYILLIMLGFGLMGGISFYIYAHKNRDADMAADVVGNRTKVAAAVHAAEKQTLTTYAWVDQKAGLVRVPVERAMELELPELQKKPVQKSAVLVNPPVPAAVAAPVVPATAPAVPAPAAKK